MRAWMIVLALLATGCARREQTATGPAPPSQTGADILVDEPGLAGIVVDSVYRQITPDAQASPVVGQRHRWLVEHTWLRTRFLWPESLFTMDRVMVMTLPDSTSMSFVGYRYLVRAVNLDAVIESVQTRTQGPDWPPEKLMQEVARKSPR